MYVFGVDTSLTKKAPAIGSAFRTSTTISSRERSKPEKIPTRIAPRSRKCLVIARVSTPWIPTIPCSMSSASRSFCARQLDVSDEGLRTTKPATQIFSDSLSKSLTPVLPMCGAVMMTICL